MLDPLHPSKTVSNQGTILTGPLGYVTGVFGAPSLLGIWVWEKFGSYPESAWVAGTQSDNSPTSRHGL